MEERLSFASYVKCLEMAMQKPYDQDLELTHLLLEFLILKGTVYEARGRKGRAIDVDKTMTSNLLNNRENVHSSIRDNCDSEIVINKIEHVFEKEITNVISPHLRDDLTRNMVKLIEEDASIPEAKKRGFLKSAEKDNISGFLASVFLYAVKRENRREKWEKSSKKEEAWDTNEQYYNSFVEKLFLHRGAGSKNVRLKDLFVLPDYVNWTEDSDLWWKGSRDVVDYISKFTMHVIRDERYQGEILFIEGDAGVGKTSLVAFLAYLSVEKKEEWKRLFLDKMLLCIRLRDIIPGGMRFSSDTIVNDILKYLRADSLDEFKRYYKNPLIVFDGFDELCMVEGINANSEYYIYQIFDAFKDYKMIITTRPQYLYVRGLDIRKGYIVLRHFDANQRREWVEKYRKTGVSDSERTGLEYILDEENEEINSICDTPMVMYMIAAGGINEEAKHNKWLLYHQIFYKELSDTEYNSVFVNGNGVYHHGIKKHKRLLYRLSAEIAYRMFCSGNRKLFLTGREIAEIVDELGIEDLKLKETVQHCYALCNYWKMNGKGAVEFYHNNIRDFFLCEKIFYEFNEMYQICETSGTKEAAAFIAGRIHDLFRYMQLPEKVLEFLYLRAKHSEEHHYRLDFPFEECRKKFLPHFFSDMLQFGGINHYDRSSGENVYRNMINVLTNTVRIFRFTLDPCLNDEERIRWYHDAECINREDILKHNFREIFACIPAHANERNTGLSSKADFEGIHLAGVDLKGADLSGANLKDADLREADLRRADLRRAGFEGANLRVADLREADLGGADLRGADLTNANLRNAFLPDGFTSDNQTIQLKHLSKMKIPGLRIDMFE